MKERELMIEGMVPLSRLPDKYKDFKAVREKR
jgi:hypothetical protein